MKESKKFYDVGLSYFVVWGQNSYNIQVRVTSAESYNSWSFILLVAFSTNLHSKKMKSANYTSSKWTVNAKRIRQNPIGNRAISVFSGQISYTRIMISIWKSFMYFLKAKEINNCLSEITPKPISHGNSKKKNFKVQRNCANTGKIF